MFPCVFQNPPCTVAFVLNVEHCQIGTVNHTEVCDLEWRLGTVPEHAVSRHWAWKEEIRTAQFDVYAVDWGNR